MSHSESDSQSITAFEPSKEYVKDSGDEINLNDEASREEVLARLEKISSRVSHLTYDNYQLDVDADSFDLRRLLHTFTKSSEESGVKLRTLGVTFEDLTVLGKDQSYAYLPTVNDLLTLPLTIFRGIKDSIKCPEREILHEVTGLARSGEMVLVLGRPGAGCTTFLKTLGGTDEKMYTGIKGSVEYDGVPRKEMLKRFKQDLIYCPELDTHFPHLTVEQTLNFVIDCKMPDLRANGLSKKDYTNFIRDMWATVFGLRHTYKTKVGNDFIRGVSGGERKRVSIAEAIACQGSVYCWDNATRGLDASTALEYAQAIRTSTHFTKSTAFVTLYQASQNIYETFDKVTVLYLGRQIYFGPVQDAQAYFEKMGYKRPPRQTTAEFLTAVTDPLGRESFPGYEDKVPKTADEFEAYWKASPEYQKLKEEIAEYKQGFSREETKHLLTESIEQEKQRGQRVGSLYTVNILEQFRLNFRRAGQNLWGSKDYTITQIVAALAQSLIIGSLYYKTPNDASGAFSRGGVIFFSVLYLSLMSLAEISNSFYARPIMMKQQNYSLYHPFAYAVAEALSFMPVSLFISIVFTIVLYFLSNLKVDPGAYFTFLLFSYLVSLAMNSLFKAVAAWNKTVSSANAFAGVLILAALMYSSFMIQRPSMRVYFKWISYINPILYGFEAMITTDFHGRHMDCVGAQLIPNGPGYPAEHAACSLQGSSFGQTWVQGDQYIESAFTYKFNHVWRNFGILVGFFTFFTSIAALGLEIVRPISGGVDRLFFLRGRKPDSIVVGEEAAAADEETGPTEPSSLEKTDKDSATEEALAGLESKDYFTWKNVDYVIPYEGGERKLLDNVSGFCLPGKLTALMGESGAGKTTLLNTLAQRIEMGTITGDMLVNGKSLDTSFSRRTGYVQQQDIHLAQATVREALRFSADLRRPRSVPKSEKYDYVEKIIHVLNMEEYSDAIVGKLGSGLNVEQRKKLTIGVELVAKPSLLLFLDEPTSGLDSQSAWAIVQLLKDLANAGQSILCTIHQPSATLFEQFDRLLLLRKGGQTVYFGDIGKQSRTILDYFEQNGARKCHKEENPAEYILEAIGAGATATTNRNWFEVWNNSPEKVAVEERVSQLNEEGKQKEQKSGLSEKELKELSQPYASTAAYDFLILTKRNFLVYWRNPEYIMSKFFLMMVSGLFIGFTFFGLKSTIVGMQNGMFTAFLSVVVSAPVINQIQEQCMNIRDIFEGRERMSNTYRWWVLVLSQYVVEIPYNFVCGAVMFVCLYFPTRADFGVTHSAVFYLTYGIFLQLFNASFGFMLVWFAPDISSAAVLNSFCYSFIVSFSGVVQPVKLMPGFWTFMWKLSPYTYIIQNLVSAILHKRTVNCAEHEYVRFSPAEGQTCGQYMKNYMSERGGYLLDSDSTSACSYCPYKVADDYLLTIFTKYSNQWRNIGFFFAYIIFNLCACLFLYKVIRLTTWKFSLKDLFKKKK